MRSHFTKLPPVALLAVPGVLLVLAMCSSPSPRTTLQPPTVQPATIVMTGTGFSPTQAQVPVHTTICWKNSSNTKRWPIASSDGPLPPAFESGQDIQPGAIWCFPFAQAGSWKYYDKNHPSWKGTILVK